jgi:hypothetical protein
MSLPTPTGNPCPYPPDHPLYDFEANLDWIERKRHFGESDQQVCDRLERELLAWLEAHR